MSWADRLMAFFDERATVLQTARGEVQLARAGHGPPVLVSHGAPGGFDLGLAWSRHLQDSGCELLAPSRPGYLRTPLESGRRPEDQADLYAAMLDTLGIDRVAVLGFSSGAPSAVHFAARHPQRTTALLLDASILLPLEPPMGRLQQASIEWGPLVWFSYQISTRRPALVTSFSVSGMAEGLSKPEKRAAIDWIVSDPDRLERMQNMSTCIAPSAARRLGWKNDKANESRLGPLPYAAVSVPTLIAHGTNDGIVPVGHAASAADQIADAELLLVDEGHHALSLSRNYGLVARRQIELAQA